MDEFHPARRPTIMIVRFDQGFGLEFWGPPRFVAWPAELLRPAEPVFSQQIQALDHAAKMAHRRGASILMAPGDGVL